MPPHNTGIGPVFGNLVWHLYDTPPGFGTSMEGSVAATESKGLVSQHQCREDEEYDEEVEEEEEENCNGVLWGFYLSSCSMYSQFVHHLPIPSSVVAHNFFFVPHQMRCKTFSSSQAISLLCQVCVIVCCCSCCCYCCLLASSFLYV